MLKYFFSIPFNPKKEWKNAMEELKETQSIKEDAILTFMLMTGGMILFSYLKDYYSGNNYFSFESVFFQYFYFIVTSLLTVVGIRIVGEKYELRNIESPKLFLIFILGVGFWNIISGAIVSFLVGDFYYYYGIIGSRLIDFIGYLIGATFVVFGLMEASEAKFDEKEISKNISLIVMIAVVILVVDIIYSFVVSRFLFQIFYMF